MGPAVEMTGLLVVGNAGNYRRAVINCLDLAHDLAVLVVLGNNNEPITGDELENEAASGLEVVDAYQPVATPVAYAGFPLGLQLMNSVHSPTYSEGVIGVERRQGHLRKEVQISGAVVGGFSGSPVVTRGTENKLIGVISSGPGVPGQGGDFFMPSLGSTSRRWQKWRALSRSPVVAITDRRARPER
jgi:hypothetical protein